MRRIVLVAAGAALVLGAVPPGLALVGAPGWWSGGSLAVMFAAFLGLIVVGNAVNLSAVGMAGLAHRPARFTVADGAFLARPHVSPAFSAVSVLLGWAVIAGGLAWLVMTADRALSSAPGLLLGAGMLLVMLTLVGSIAVAGAWQGTWLALEPVGLTIRAGWWRRTVPWAALAPGGPPRAVSPMSVLTLAVARPELVETTGWLPGVGTATRPRIGLAYDVHPVLLADAIRWYAEHPEHRAAIGTAAEHDRLLADLGAAQPVPPPWPRPATITWASWLAVAGAVFGVLSTAAEMVLTVVNADTLTAIQSAQDAEEARHTGEPVGQSLLGGVEFVRLWTLGEIAVTVVGLVAALAYARALRRGESAGRTGLLTLSGLCLAWALCPFLTPLTALADARGFAIVLPVLLLLEHAVVLSLAIVVVVLLVVPASARWLDRH
ncbi:hypothetical protein [Catellatospora tritici]|uniref:hypothetical protein n=1 Tax=Catellatospora tritici TaxID=2851566 RepID=UPI001C2D0EFF|nr:hypothetical protein [Catellatospora tritici]MBV1854940.1 hypothetical protein [Catellatospora tritici]